MIAGFGWQELLPALPEIVLASVAAFLMAGGAFMPERHACRVVNLLSIAVLVAVLGLLALRYFGTGRLTGFGGHFITDDFAVFAKMLAVLGALLSLVISRSYDEREDMDRFEYPVLVLFATLGMMMMISANDLIALYLGLELQSLALYVLAAFRRDSMRSSEAGLKYFVLGALSSGLLLYGCSLIYGFTGTTSFATLAAELSGEAAPGLVVGLVFLIAGLAFKVSAVPFHMWTPDVYEGAPTPVTAFFAVAPKIAALALFVRVLVDPFGGLIGEWRQVIIAISILSMVIGAFAAIAQTNIKRLMAYSSIGHVGYALIGLAAGGVGGVQAILLYLAIYLAMTLGTFACILSMRRKGTQLEAIAEFSGLGKTRPGLAAAMLIFMFSMAGIPPLAGFFGKLYIFLAAVEAGLYALAILGVVTSVIGAFYYLRIVKVMYFDDAEEETDPAAGRALGGVLAVTAVITLFFFVVLAPALDMAGAAASSLFVN